jgi:hypothetical protein
MYAAVSTFTLKPGASWEELNRLAPQHAALIKSQPGCQWIGIVKISEEKFVLMQVWDTEQHLEESRKATMRKEPAGVAMADAVVSSERVQGEVIAS